MWLGSVCAADGEVIYTEGDKADAVYMISRGCVEMFHTERGTDTRIKMLGKGEVFGEASFYTDGLREQSVRAVGNTVLVRVPKKVFEQILYPGSCLEQIVRAIAVRQHGL
jgi:CRP-like cAMP-binding protein